MEDRFFSPRVSEASPKAKTLANAQISRAQPCFLEHSGRASAPREPSRKYRENIACDYVNIGRIKAFIA